MTRAEKMAKALKASGDFMFLKWDDGESELDEPQWRALLHEALAPMTCETCKHASPRLSASENIPVYCTIHGREFCGTFGCLAHEPKKETP